MPLRAIVDTNILVDLILIREPWFSQAKPLWDARDAGHIECVVLASTLTDLYYICGKAALLGPAGAKLAIEMILQRFGILTIDRAVIESALLLSGPDFEDNVQIACAVRDHIDVIITRNTADFMHSPVKSIEPPDIVRYLIIP